MVYEPERAFEEDEPETSAPDARSASEPARPEESQVPTASVLGTVAGMADPLGFEHTTFESASAPSGNTCAACATDLVGDYWTANGAMVCERCAEQARLGPPKAGAFLRVLKAGAYGTAFGLGGTIVYGAVLAITDVNIALLTILIGWLVGLGVRRGTEGRGGLGYQLFAAALTYVLCMEAWAPMIYQGMITGAEPVPPIAAAILSPFLALALPFFGDMSFIGFLILGFGMWRAFRALADVPVQVDGPFVLAPAPAEDAEHDDPSDDDAPTVPRDEQPSAAP